MYVVHRCTSINRDHNILEQSDNTSRYLPPYHILALGHAYWGVRLLSIPSSPVLKVK